MRIGTAALAALVVVLLVDVHPSSTQRFIVYPWCLDAGGSDSHFTSCAFNTFDQCMQTGWGDGGICYRNPAYRPVVERPRPLPRRKRD
jgi:uncharacterized protein DUF3551